MMDMTERARILKNLLPLVPFDGWTEQALAQAATRAGLDEAALKRAFPGGIEECLDYFFDEEDAALSKTFSEEAMKKLRVPERIEALLLARLHRLLPHREAVRRAITHRVLPWNTARATQSLYRSVDLMWRLAGDASTDFSFYTKRMTLAAIYSSTLLYWLNDTSEDQADTKAFLSRRLSDVASFGKWKKECKSTMNELFRRLHSAS